MTIVDRITNELKKIPMTISALEKEMNFGNATIKRWDNNSPSLDKVLKVANFLNVSIDYLAGGLMNELHENIPLNEGELEQIIAEYEELDRKGRLAVRGTIIQELQRLEIGQDVTNIMEIKKSKTQNAISGETHQNKPVKRPKSEEKQAL